MKRFFLSSAFWLFLAAAYLLNMAFLRQPSAREYYFSSSTGNDATGNGSQEKPWASITKLNSLGLLPGDRVFLKRGDRWHETLNIRNTGAKGAPIVFDAYGTGARPVLDGSVQVGGTNNGWKKQGNIWKIAVPNGLPAQMNWLLINGRQQSQGRFPDEGSFLYYEGHIRDSALTDKDLAGPSQTDWTGAQAVVRTNQSKEDTSVIRSHVWQNSAQGSLLVLDSNKLYSTGPGLINGYHYFIQNDPRTLTKHGEWYYNSTTRELQVYLNGAPANYDIRVPVLDKNISTTANGLDYITIQNIDCFGANSYNIFLSNTYGNDSMLSEFWEINYCGADLAGISGIHCEGGRVTDVKIQYCRITDANGYGIYLRFTPRFKVYRDTLLRIGIMRGLGGGGPHDLGRYGIFGTKSDAEVNGCYIDSVGYSGIRLNGNRNVIIDSNFVNHALLHYSDGGGIYAWTNNLSAYNAAENKKIRHNIVLNSYGSLPSPKANRLAYGIYLDNNSDGYEIAYNYVAHAGDACYFNHNSNGINFHHNFLYDGGKSLVYYVGNYSDTEHIYMNRLLNNTLVARRSNELIARFYFKADRFDFVKTLDEAAGAAITANENNWIDSNVYARPVNQDSITIDVRKATYTGTANDKHAFFKTPDFTAQFGLDRNSKGSPKLFSLRNNDAGDALFGEFYNPGLSDSSVTLTQTWMDFRSKVYKSGQKLVLPAKSGFVLLTH